MSPRACNLLTAVLLGGLLVCGPANAQRRGEDDDVWAVRCITLTGPNRFEVSKQLEKSLKNVRELDGKLVQVVHDKEQSIIYYGRYARRFETANSTESFKPDPNKDLKLIRELSMTVNGQAAWPFRVATMEALPTARNAQADWDLSNVDGYWSYQVGVFYNSDDMKQRKLAAEEYCKLLRQQGQEAYFHHGPVNSSVCIGVFPKDAIQTVKGKDPLTGVMTVKYQIADPRMLELQQKFPNNVENGRIVYEIDRDSTGKVSKRTPIASFPVMTPKAERLQAPAGRP